LILAAGKGDYVSQEGFGEHFRIETSAGADGLAITVGGELDSGTYGELLDAVDRALPELDSGSSLTLDLSDVSFIDSSGMRAMIQLERDAGKRGIELVVVSPPDDVTELLRTVGITDRMNLATSVDRGPLGSDFSDRVDLELEREPHAPSRARAEIREALAGRLDESDVATVVLLTSELVTNAVIHPRAPNDTAVDLRIWVYAAGVRVEVEDSGEGFDPAAPTPTAAEPRQRGGRGLFLVDRCSATWGARHTEQDERRGFCVWFEFLAGDQEPAAVPG
jgi:anti-anti-sigma factor